MNGEGLRASDGDRDQVAELLHAAYAEGRITRDEHEQRLTAALEARTFDQLGALTADLVPAVPAHLSVAPSVDEPDRLTAMLATSKRDGPWQVRRTTYANSILGSVKIDLTQAAFSTREVRINCTQFMGETVIRVPVGTQVRLEVTNVLGDSSVKGIGDPDPALPTVVVSGTNVLGDISVRGPKKPLPWKRHVA